MRTSKLALSSLILASVTAFSAQTTAESPDAAATATAAPAAEEAESGPSSWFRIDSDVLGLQLWAGTTNDVGGIDIATDIYVTDSGFGEFDIGPAISLGDLSLLPMVGVGFFWGAQEAMTLIAPQLFTIYDGDPPIYFESWIQAFFTDAFVEGAQADVLYTRHFLLFKATSDFYIGAQVEPTLALNDNAGDGLVSLPVGGRINYNAKGDWEALIGLFLGVETDEDAQVGDDNVAGRFTYLHFF